jgi:hypothetical protein
LGVAVRAARGAALVCIACSASPSAPNLPSAPHGERQRAKPSAAAVPWPPKAELFLWLNGRGALQLRAGTHFEHLLASSVQMVVHDPALELAWLSDGQTLSVIDLRDPAPHTVAPIVIATGLPPHVEIQIERGNHRVAPTDACDVAPILVLHWSSEPSIESDQGELPRPLEGRAWLQRESHRPVRHSGAERWLHPSGAQVRLPLERARCDDAQWCGAAQALGTSGLQLVLADQSEGADCWQFGCVLFNPQNGTYATPPQPARWGTAQDTPSGSCGPYRFDAAGRTLLVDDLYCAALGRCEPLGGVAIGWLAPGDTLGAPG